MPYEEIMIRSFYNRRVYVGVHVDTMTEIGCDFRDPKGYGAVSVYCTKASLISPKSHGKMFHYALRSHNQFSGWPRGGGESYYNGCNGIHYGCGPVLQAGMELFGMFYHFNEYKYSQHEQCSSSKLGKYCKFNMTREDTTLKDLILSAVSEANEEIIA